MAIELDVTPLVNQVNEQFDAEPEPDSPEHGTWGYRIAHKVRVLVFIPGIEAFLTNPRLRDAVERERVLLVQRGYAVA